MLKLALVAGALLLAPMSIVAQECPGQSLTDAASLVEENGGEIIGIVEVDGEAFNRLVIAIYHGQIVVGRFQDDCAIGGPVSFGSAAEARDA